MSEYKRFICKIRRYFIVSTILYRNIIYVEQSKNVFCIAPDMHVNKEVHF